MKDKIDMEPTKEQIQWFWEQCGFKLRCPPEKDAYRRGIWDYPDGMIGDVNLNLNNLFKYAVPKLQDKGHCVTIQSYECKGYLASVSETVFSQRGSDGYDPFYQRISEIEDEDPALALFWAIYKALKGG